MDNELEDLQKQYIDFIDERDWQEFHTPQNVAQAVTVESAELLEIFLWHDNMDSDEISQDEQLVQDVRMEIADIIIYLLSISHQLDIDPTEAVAEKLEQNDERFDTKLSRKIREEKLRWQR